MALVSQPQANLFQPHDARPAPPSPALRAYRRLLPERTRRRIRHRVAPRTWERMRLGVERPTALARRIRHGWDSAVLRGQGTVAAPLHRLVTVEGRTRVALVRDGLTPLAAREWNLQAVCSALRAADVDHFAVRGLSDIRSAVGVSAEHREAAVAALRGVGAWAPAYLVADGAPEGTAALTESGRAGRRAAGADVLRVFCYQAGRGAGEVYGPEYGCEVEMWQPEGDRLVAPRRNRCCESLPRSAAGAVFAPGRVFTRLAPAHSPARARTSPAPVRSRAEFVAPLPEDVRFPVDAVYTWVDGEDPEWRRRRADAAQTTYHPESANDARYASHDELRYSLRSLHLFAPWLRHIYLVTDRQVPEWLNTDDPRLTVVDHREIFADPSVLPTFNSHAIESQLHHIDGLSEHFLYFNDDVFLGRPLVPQQFFLGNGTTCFFPSKALLPSGTPEEDDVPVSAAGKNNRMLLASRFGSSIAQKMKHTPSALRRSVLYEIEREFADSHRRTAANRFRSLDDIAIANSLHHYYAFHTGRAVPGRIRYDYVDTSSPDMRWRLQRILGTRAYDTFCLNDTVSADAAIRWTLGPFLESYFPLAGPFELTGPPEGAAAAVPGAAAVAAAGACGAAVAPTAGTARGVGAAGVEAPVRLRGPRPDAVRRRARGLTPGTSASPATPAPGYPPNTSVTP